MFKYLSHVELYTSFFQKSSILDVWQGFKSIAEKIIEKIIEKCWCDEVKVGGKK